MRRQLVGSNTFFAVSQALTFGHWLSGAEVVLALALSREWLTGLARG